MKVPILIVSWAKTLKNFCWVWTANTENFCINEPRRLIINMTLFDMRYECFKVEVVYFCNISFWFKHEPRKLRVGWAEDPGIHCCQTHRPGEVFHRLQSRKRAGHSLRTKKDKGTPQSTQIFDMADQRQREKCLREVDIMKKLNHPHIIQYIDSFIHNN